MTDLTELEIDGHYNRDRHINATMQQPQKYTKRPVTIEAMQWDGSAAGATPIINWILDGGDRCARYAEPQPETRVKGKIVRESVPALIAIDTLEGTMHAIAGDYIIRGVKGEFYPCKPDIFAATYDVPDQVPHG